jgi:cytochrome b561
VSNASDQYRLPARLLHWTMAIFILAMIPAGLLMVQPELDRSLQNTPVPVSQEHGRPAALLMLVRVIYRWRNPPAALP